MRRNSGIHESGRATAGTAFIFTMVITILFSVLPGRPLIDRAFSGLSPWFSSVGKFQQQRYATAKAAPAKGKFLIASRNLSDINFSETVVLLIDYSRSGAMGLIINRPTRLNLSTVLPQIKGLKQRSDTVYIGGPVEGSRIILLARSGDQPQKSFHVFGNVYIGQDWKMIQQMIDRSDSKERFRVYAGHAGWAPGQIDLEVSRGDWHILSADEETIFNEATSKIWPRLIRRFSSQWVKSPKRKPDGSIHAEVSADGRTVVPSSLL